MTCRKYVPRGGIKCISSKRYSDIYLFTCDKVNSYYIRHVSDTFKYPVAQTPLILSEELHLYEGSFIIKYDEKKGVSVPTGGMIYTAQTTPFEDNFDSGSMSLPECGDLEQWIKKQKTTQLDLKYLLKGSELRRICGLSICWFFW